MIAIAVVIFMVFAVLVWAGADEMAAKLVLIALGLCGLAYALVVFSLPSPNQVNTVVVPATDLMDESKCDYCHEWYDHPKHYNREHEFCAKRKAAMAAGGR